MKKFIMKSYNPFLFNEINKLLCNVVNEDVQKVIKKTFETHCNPFKSFETEKKDSFCIKT